MSLDLSRTRSFALIGHAGDGKTTLADSVIMAAGVTNRLGSVEDGSSFMNHLPEERSRRVSISASICSFEHQGFSHTLIDTPGDANFAGELVSSLPAVDHTVLVLSAQDGVRIGTEKAARLARDSGLSLTAVANKMDSERADLDACASQLEELLGVRVVRLHLPLGRGTGFEGYVDLLTRRSYRFPKDGSGKVQEEDVPSELNEAVDAAREAMVEAVAEANDEILEKYLEEGSLSDDEIASTLSHGIRDGSLLPLLCAASGLNIGGAALLDVAERFFPSPAELRPRAARQGETEIEVSADPAGPAVAYVFKSVADRYAGMLSLVRIYSGTLRSDLTLMNARSGSKERISKILQLRGEETHDVKEVSPGAIAALPKLRDTRTGDTLGDGKEPVAMIVPSMPRGVISFAVEATDKGDEDKVFESLNRLVEEDPTLQLGRDDRTGEFLLTGLGQLHIEVTLEKLRRLFNVQVTLKPPKVPYLETITGRAENVEGKLKKQSGGRGQFGVCYLSVEPGERGSGVQFVDEIVGGSIPRQFIPAVEKGVREACRGGLLAGYPLTDLIVRCIDGKHHSVDSSEMAFKMAGSLGIKAAVQQARLTLLEPIMDIEVTVPDEFVGDIMGNLNSRRGRVAGVNARGALQVIKAQVPMAEVLSYASDLTSMTGGQGSFTMEFSHYEEVPAQIREKIIAESRKETEE
ncbi:MAG: elongation factor G [Myxococcota bacterium]